MLDGIKIDLSTIGFFFWFILLGLLVVIFSVTYKADYVYLGLLISLYGVIGFLIDLFIDRIFSVLINAKIENDNMHKIAWGWHLLRFIVQIGLVVLLIIMVNKKYCFV